MTVWRWLGHALGIVAVFFAGVIAALTLALAFGPVSLGFLAQPLIRAVSQSVAGYRLDASDALLAWSHGQLVVRFVDPRLVDRNRVEIAAATDIAVSFSLEALISGRIAPRSLAIAGPTATFMRLSDGTYDIGIRTEQRARDRTVSETSADAGPFIQALLEPPVDGQEETYLSEVRLTDATMTFIDQATDSIVKAPRGTLIVKRTATGLDATLEGQVSLPKGNWHFAGRATYDRGAPTILLEADLEDANLDALADAGPLFEGFAGADLPLNGAVKLVIDAKGAIVSGTASVAAHTGHVQMAALSNVPIDVNAATIEASYDGASDTFNLDKLTIDSKSVTGTVTGRYRLTRARDGALAGWTADLAIDNGKLSLPQFFDGDTPIDTLAFAAHDDLKADLLTIDSFKLASGKTQLDITAAIRGLQAGAAAIKMDGKLSNVPIAQLGTIWPKGMAQGARDWIVENVSGGAITSGTLAIDMTADQLANGPTPPSAARFEVAYEGLQIKYIDALPPLADVRGSAVVAGDRFEGKVDAAHVGNLRLTDGSVVIDKLASFGPPADIKATITGKAPEILALLDMKPLGYPSKFGLDPKSVSGDARIDLGLIVPTIKGLKVDQIGFDVKAKLSNIAMAFVRDIRLTEGAADFAVTGKGLTAKGRGRVAGVLADFEWTENFSPPPGELSTHISASATIDENLRTRLGIDPGTYLDGPAHVAVSMTGNGFKPVTASAAVDLNDAIVKIPELGYAKAAGQPARLTADLARVANGYRAYPVKLEGKGIDAQLDILMGLDGSLQSIKADHLVAGKNDVGFTVDLSGGQSTVIADVKTIDLDTLVDALRKRADRDVATGPQPTPGATASDTTNLTMRIKAQRVLLRGGATASNLVFNVDMDRGYLTNLHLSGAIGKGHVSSQLYGVADGSRRVVFESDDMGAFVAGATGFQSLSGGYGRLDLLFPKIGTPGDPSGTFAMNDFRLHDQPFLTRLLASGSFTGLLDLLRGSGIRFDKVVAGIGLHGPQIIVRDLMMSGPSVGASGEGYVDRDSNQLHARGTLAPIYSLNSILGGVPLVGKVLGGKQGILAMAFAIDGTVDDLNLSVSPLSILAPGFLRHLFEFDSPLDKETGQAKAPS